MRKRAAYLGMAGVSVVLGAIVVTTVFISSPAKLGPLGVTLWFLALFGALSGLASGIILGIKQLIKPTDEPFARLSASARQGALFAGWMTINLALSSLGQLTTRDALLSLILLALIEIYFNLR